MLLYTARQRCKHLAIGVLHEVTGDKSAGKMFAFFWQPARIEQGEHAPSGSAVVAKRRLRSAYRRVFRVMTICHHLRGFHGVKCL
jgi:hypothetical protein